MHTLRVAGAVNMQGFVCVVFFLCIIYKFSFIHSFTHFSLAFMTVWLFFSKTKTYHPTWHSIS